ncbi:MAG: hypothetical protein O3B86_18105 [Planctomycetota bacterium]|nr:hypothetical protein [Planctomycetota bacterium]
MATTSLTAKAGTTHSAETMARIESTAAATMTHSTAVTDGIPCVVNPATTHS